MENFGIKVDYKKKNISIPRDYSRLETASVQFENILFTEIISHQIGSLKISVAIDLIQFIAIDNSLKISKKKDWDLVQDKLKKAVINN